MRIRHLIIIFVILGLSTLAYSQNASNQEKASEYYQRGNVLYGEGKYQEAEEEFQEALRLLKTGNNTSSVVTHKDSKVQSQPVSAASIENVGSKESPGPRAQGYFIGEEDTLQILVWQNPDLNQEVIVRPDGKISFPLVGDIQASGLTISQLDEMLTEALKEYIRFPEVSISLKKMGGQKVVVLGEVVKPGVYSVTGAHTILEAIGLAGGFTRDAVPSSTVLIRGGFLNPQAKRFNLNLALKGDMRQNIALNTEDVIFIPKKFIADLNYFLSQVLDPISRGAYIATEYQNW